MASELTPQGPGTGAKDLPSLLLEIPNRPQDLSPEWLSAALRERGLIGSGRVTGVETQVLGEGQGFMGTIVRIALQLEGASDGAPLSMIGKFPTEVRENRVVGEALGVYEREIRFYQEIGPRVPMRIPRMYYAELDPSGLEGREEKIFSFLDRFPIWLIRICTPLIQWLAGRNLRRYALLIEDLAPAVAGDQLAGCDLALAKDVLRPMADLHAAFWNRTDDPSLSWIPRFELMRYWLHTTYRMNWRGFAEQYETTLPRICALAPWLDEHGVDVIDTLARGPYTLLHGDFRLDNMTFGSEEDGRRVPTVFDWQTPLRGPAATELAYFLSGNLDADIAAERQEELICFYCEELKQRGIDCDGEAFERDYQLGLIWEAWRMILGIQQLDFHNERGRALIETWMQRLDRLLPENADRLLD